MARHKDNHIWGVDKEETFKEKKWDGVWDKKLTGEKGVARLNQIKEVHFLSEEYSNDLARYMQHVCRFENLKTIKFSESSSGCNLINSFHIVHLLAKGVKFEGEKGLQEIITRKVKDNCEKNDFAVSIEQIEQDQAEVVRQLSEHVKILVEISDYNFRIDCEIKEKIADVIGRELYKLSCTLPNQKTAEVLYFACDTNAKSRGSGLLSDFYNQLKDNKISEEELTSYPVSIQKLGGLNLHNEPLGRYGNQGFVEARVLTLGEEYYDARCTFADATYEREKEKIEKETVSQRKGRSPGQYIPLGKEMASQKGGISPVECPPIGSEVSPNESSDLSGRVLEKRIKSLATLPEESQGKGGPSRSSIQEKKMWCDEVTFQPGAKGVGFNL